MHEMSKPIFGKKKKKKMKKNISKCHLLKFLPSIILSVNFMITILRINEL